MRVSNDRYSRDLRSIDLARRMLKLEARTQTICAWTALSPDRARNLSRSHRSDAPRHRGPSPSKLSLMMATKAFRSEAPALAGLCGVLDVLPAQACANARVTLPGLARGERLCYALELFRESIPHSRITMEQSVLLVLTLAERDTWALGHCTFCHASILIDRLATSRHKCGYCEGEAPSDAGPLVALEPSAPLGPDSDEARYLQQSLF